jgi:hypothetical protein
MEKDIWKEAVISSIKILTIYLLEDPKKPWKISEGFRVEVGHDASHKQFRAYLDAVEQRAISFPVGNEAAISRSASPVVHHYTNWAILAFDTNNIQIGNVSEHWAVRNEVLPKPCSKYEYLKRLAFEV